MRTRSLTFALAAMAALCPFTAPARAESHDASTVTLGWQTETADEIVVGSLMSDVPLGGDGEASRLTEVRVDQSLKGSLPVGGSVRVRLDEHSRGGPWRTGFPHLLFLRAAGTPGQPSGEFRPVTGAFSVRAIDPAGAQARLPALVTTLRETLESGDVALLRSLLISWMEDADAGVAWSAATDFVRHTELHEALSETDSARIVAAFRRQPIGKTTKDALAYAAAATRSPDAVRALVESLLLPEASRIREPVAEALRRGDAPLAESLLAARISDATAQQRPALFGALAAVGGVASAPSVRPFLDASDAPTRVEAAAALGAMARNARAKDRESRLGLADALASGVVGDEAEKLSANEMTARLWALAQLDEPRAFETLRTVAANSPREDAREYAERMLARPRQSLILR